MPSLQGLFRRPSVSSARSSGKKGAGRAPPDSENDESSFDDTASTHSAATTRRVSVRDASPAHSKPAAAAAAARRPPPPTTNPNVTRPWRVGSVYPLIPGRLSFVVHSSEEQTREQIEAFPRKFYFSSDFPDRYEPFCLDFGPVNLGVVHSFILFMREHLECRNLASRELVYYTEDPVDVRTNTAFLLAAYLVLDGPKLTPEQAWAPFAKITGDAFATFRDATFCEQDYDLTILDCLRGLARAVSCGWYAVETFCLDEYLYLDEPGNADMHMCTPKLAAFKGPSQRRVELAPGVFTFPPAHFSEVFADKGITAVVRLNDPETYDAKGFTDRGIKHYDLFFEDCTVPPNALVLEFLTICEREGGVAVHCRAGLGRTGTLIAAYMMKHHGFTAGECIGWLRIVRPGSVIGPQQQYLHFLERALRPKSSGANAAPLSAAGTQRSPLPKVLSRDQAARLGEEVARAQAQRAQVRAGRLVRSGSGGKSSSFDKQFDHSFENEKVV